MDEPCQTESGFCMIRREEKSLFLEFDGDFYDSFDILSIEE
jgi:hypothetical protein